MQKTVTTGISKEEMISFVENLINHSEKYEYTDRQWSVLRAIKFVLKNRLQENLGPRELTMDVAMRGELP